MLLFWIFDVILNWNENNLCYKPFFIGAIEDVVYGCANFQKI